ncbi:MAG TPA: RcnB family protein [Allosphingosinicella sp.]
MAVLMAATTVSAVAPALAEARLPDDGDARVERRAERQQQRAERQQQNVERREQSAASGGDARAALQARLGGNQAARTERRDDRRDARIERQDDRRDARIERRDDWRDARIERRDDRRDARNERRDDWRDNRNRQSGSTGAVGQHIGDRDWDRDGRRDGRWERRSDRRDVRDWTRSWRNDRRYDWQRYRYQNRNAFHAGRYYAPYRHNYSRFSIGFFLGQPFYSSRYWISDPWQYRLPPAYAGTRWVRYYDDVLLVDLYTGEVIDVIYDFFW